MSSSPLSSATPALNRRAFVKTASLAGLGLALGATAGAVTPAARPRQRYVIVGTGARRENFQDAIEKTHRDYAELVGVCDKNPGRIEVARRRSARNGAPVPPGYLAADFARMIAETKPDTVIVTTMCSTHDEYIVRAMEAGCDVISEKPMTTTAEKCRRVLDAQARTGRKLRVTFNYRYSPPRTQVKDILMSGEIGEVQSVDFNWMLNTYHGADYFRRWHSHKENSGGLMVHKATHHFDLVNWWLGAMPETVQARGKRDYYTPAMARRMGLSGPHERCLTCPEKAQCDFYVDLAADKGLKELYLDNEKYDGYFRDRCVFRADIDIEDSMSVLVNYDNGVNLTYSLNAFSAWEGYTVAFNGTKGRLEHSLVEQVYVSGTDTVQGGIAQRGARLRVMPLRGPVRELTPWSGSGSHGGGDKVMMDDIFLPEPPADKYLRAADVRAGAASILVGIAANRCIERGGPVALRDLIPNLRRPDYAPMPPRDGPVPMPGKTVET